MSPVSAVRGFSPLARKGAMILACGMIALAVLSVLPFLWYADLREQAATQRAERELVEARAGRQREAAPRLTEADQLDRMFLPGATDGTALAAFQSLVSDAAVRSGMSVLRLQPLPMDAAEGLSPFRLGVDASGSMDQLRAFLTDVESMLPVVIVTGFEIEPRSADGAEADPYPSEDLAVTVELEAFAWRPAP